MTTLHLCGSVSAHACHRAQVSAGLATSARHRQGPSRRLWRSHQLRHTHTRAVEAPAQVSAQQDNYRGEARDTVLKYYAAYNRGDFETVLSCMADDCAYHDMIYLEPFVGKEAIRGYFDKVSKIVPGDLNFHLDEVTSGDPHFVGVKWHVDLGNFEFPFSRGCSFYEVDDQGRIRAARDLVEPALKPGSTALYALKLLTPLVRKLGPNANPGTLKKLPKRAIAVWTFYAVYCWWIFLSPYAPGAPGITPPEGTFSELFNESINYFYVNIFLNAVHLPGISANAEHPCSEALFNFVNAWSLMLWPLMATDGKSAHVKGKGWWYIGTQFITNVVFIPFMALREAPPGSQGTSASPPPADSQRIPYYSPIMGGVAAFIGLVSVAWALVGRPEYGGLAERGAWSVNAFSTNRVQFAFLLDLAFYTAWQVIFLQGAEKKYRYVPFAGLAAWLIAGGPRTAKQ